MFPERRGTRTLFKRVLGGPRTYRHLVSAFGSSLSVTSMLSTPTIDTRRFTTTLFGTCRGGSLSTFLVTVYRRDVFSLLQGTTLVPFGFGTSNRPGPIVLASSTNILLPGGGFTIDDGMCSQFVQIFRGRRGMGVCLTDNCYGCRNCSRKSVSIIRCRCGRRLKLLLVCRLPSAIGRGMARTRTCSAI